MSKARLSLVILGTLSLGLSSVAKANLHVEWVYAKKLIVLLLVKKRF
jgi:hypothetical protein